MNVKKKGSLFLLVLILFICLFPSISSAHAYIKKSTPVENEILEKPPTKVMIQFDETIQPEFNSVQVFDSNGKRVDLKNGRIDPKQPSILESGLEKNLPNGTYRIQWKVVSNDGHPVQGVIPFQIGESGSGQNSTVIHTSTKGYTPTLDLIVIRWLQYISNAGYIGVLFFILVVISKESAEELSVKKPLIKTVKFSFIFLLFSILLSLPLQATILTSSGWMDVFRLSTFQDLILNTQFGAMWLVQVVMLVVLAIPTLLLGRKKVKNDRLDWVCFVLGIGLLLTKSLTSHAASTTNKFLSVSIDFLHLLAASVWIGSLIAMVVLLPMVKKSETKDVYLTIIRKFYKWGLFLVVLLAFTGVFGSLSYIPNLYSLTHTDYGKVLVGKVIFLIFMLLLAAINFLKGRKRKEKGLSGTIWSELLIGVVILILSVLLTNLPTAMSSPGPFQDTKTIEQGNKLTLRVTPNVIGENLFEVTIKDKKGQQINGIDQVTLTFTSLDMDMGSNTVTLKKNAEGKYVLKGMSFNMAGNWKVHLHVLTKSLDTMDTDFQCFVGSE
ncbi:copper resistance protein CopC [Neobacillus niacini]|uniref:copper resistance protein CopC n=1 Tax=Neobacillus niacini TaxID=86668 RepID=UPI002859CEB8|nr:copper resistance protein CopC [Neobacillus niacini]MDR7002358.1 copper transport protein [Neobacillus niacini]